MSGPRMLARWLELAVLVLAACGFVLTAAACAVGIVWAVYAAVGGRPWYLLIVIPAVWWLRLFIGFVREWAWPEFLARD